MMAIYDNSPDTDLGFKATVAFVAAIAIFGFGTLVSLALKAPIGILFALTAGLLLAVIPFLAGWIERTHIEESAEVMDMGGFGEMPLQRGEQDIDRPVPRPGDEPVRPFPDEQHP